MICFASLLFACKNESATPTKVSGDYEYFGAEITTDDAIPSDEFQANFSEGDSIQLKIKGEISQVCKKKGCWMTMNIGGEDELMVKFKDYGFFVPLNADGRTATIEGWAYKEELSVLELKHYAFDAGASEEEIEAITEPEVSYTFMADGVILE